MEYSSPHVQDYGIVHNLNSDDSINLDIDTILQASPKRALSISQQAQDAISHLSSQHRGSPSLPDIYTTCICKQYDNRVAYQEYDSPLDATNSETNAYMIEILKPEMNSEYTEYTGDAAKAANPDDIHFISQDFYDIVSEVPCPCAQSDFRVCNDMSFIINTEHVMLQLCDKKGDAARYLEEEFGHRANTKYRDTYYEYLNELSVEKYLENQYTFAHTFLIRAADRIFEKIQNNEIYAIRIPDTDFKKYYNYNDYCKIVVLAEYIYNQLKKSNSRDVDITLQKTQQTLNCIIDMKKLEIIPPLDIPPASWMNKLYPVRANRPWRKYAGIIHSINAEIANKVAEHEQFLCKITNSITECITLIRRNVSAN